ncbi:MAG: nucleotide exchange factor GrpE [Anaerolineales bacterium]|nr:nucleotide exchange factor GrpE [Anaerolineales bacterium]
MAEKKEEKKEQVENILEEAEDIEITIFQSEIDALTKERDDALASSEENKDGWQRSVAEFANYKKRIERDRAQQLSDLKSSVIKKYLVILDDLDLALKNRPQGGTDGDWASGMDLIYQKFLNILESDGVKPMDALGATFDPTMHEAIIQEENEEYESGIVIEVLQKGYMLGDRVLRPAMVRVAA